MAISKIEHAEVKPKIIYLEPISNPTLKIFDIEGAAKMAHDYGALLVVPLETWGRSYISRPQASLGRC